jgi:Tol biopolymer transport system component
MRTFRGAPISFTLANTMASSKPAANPGALSRWWILAGVIALVACAIELVMWRRMHPPTPKILTSTQLTHDGFPKNNILVSADGAQLYFDELSSDRSTVAQVSTAGGAITPINTTVADPHVLDVSKQSELLIASGVAETNADNIPFSVISLASGSARRLGDVLGRDAVWEPNGKLVFVAGNDLYIAEHDGANPRKLATADGPPFAMRFSPDGSRMRFTIGDPTNHSTMWQVNADGSEMHPIFPVPGWKAPPAPCRGRWTPAGKYFAFVDAGNIWIVADRPGKYSEPVQLTSGPLAFRDLIPGTDGSKLFAIGGQPRAELLRYDAASGQFVPFLGGISAGDVDFSKDGQSVTYVSYPEGSLWRSKVDGSDRLRLTSSPMRVAWSHWSPDGKRIAFSGGMPGQRWKLWLVSKDGGSPEAQTPDNVPEVDSTWSPDGHTLAFVRLGHPGQIILLDLNTHARSELAESDGLWHPRWSPDGRSIAALTSNSNELRIYDRAAQKWRRLAGDLGAIGTPAWSHDGRYVYFDAASPHDSTYMRVKVSDGKVEQLASLKNVRRFLGIWGFWSGLAPGDIPLLARDAGEQEVYALDWQLP